MGVTVEEGASIPWSELRTATTWRGEFAFAGASAVLAPILLAVAAIASAVLAVFDAIAPATGYWVAAW